MSERELSWRDALMRLHVQGWDTDDIDAACEVLVSVHDELADSGVELAEFAPSEVRDLLETDVADGDVPALLTLAELRARRDVEAEALREALYDLDAFAYAYAGDD